MNAKPLIKLNVPYVFRLEYDKEGREAVKKVLTDYKGTRAALDTFNVEAQGPVRGSNIYSRFALVAAYRELTKEDIRQINARESEIALANGTLTDPNLTYEDLGLVVYPNKGINEKLYSYLREQVKSNFKNVKLNKPFIVTGLMNVVRDSNYGNGLRLELNELTEVYNVPILSKETGNFDTNDLGLQKTGFPGKLGKGNRTLYTSDNGVQRFIRNRGLDLDAYWSGLANSDDNGRVHFVKNFSSGNLEELVSKLEQEKTKQDQKLKEEYELAVKQVRSISLRSN